MQRHEAHDVRGAIDLADYVCGGSPWEIEPYVEWLRQRVSTVGRLDADIEENVLFPGRFVEARIRYGDDRFWQTDSPWPARRRSIRC